MVTGADDGEFGELLEGEIGGSIAGVGAQVFPAADGGADDAVAAAIES
jgi:hypothetical protein